MLECECRSVCVCADITHTSVCACVLHTHTLTHTHIRVCVCITHTHTHTHTHTERKRRKWGERQTETDRQRDIERATIGRYLQIGDAPKTLRNMTGAPNVSVSMSSDTAACTAPAFARAAHCASASVGACSIRQHTSAYVSIQSRALRLSFSRSLRHNKVLVAAS